ncbi:hypothetical protein GCM10018785_46880 [Streptomyces longispororuber]|uniref:Glycosyl hydrolase family 13 catalytic domain-containing protein n=1 Tax=Streptomyces longispororuber TaxID=68230 RepID=A0A918ZX12_9ACTN|nr:hypothetical protein GCM10018785_46880 [Streptomyces longispororuber]
MKVFFDVVTNHTADLVHFAENQYGYRSKGAFPYLDREGRPFDDSAGVRPVDADSFPYTPRIADADRHARKPAWLNDPTMYHNRGESTFAGESGLNGDFMGNDDLWTERPEVVAGMERIHRQGQRLRAGDLPRQSRHGPHRRHDRPGQPRRERRGAAAPRPPRARADVPRPRQPRRLRR